MNTYNAHEFRPLINALADGKTIQFWDEFSWVDLDGEVGFSFSPQDYRIKQEEPEPEPELAPEIFDEPEDGDCPYKYCELAERFAELLESHVKLRNDYVELREVFYKRYCTALERIANLEDNIERIKETNDEVCENVVDILAKLYV